MKTMLFTLVLAMASTLFMSCDDDDKVVNQTDLPTVSQTFLNTHFPGVKVDRVEKDKDSYDVWLANGFEVDFYLSGDWDDVDGRNQAVPQSVLNLLPSTIQPYVAQNYPSQTIVEVNKETYGFEIGLANDLDLKFSPTGEYIGMDN